MNVSRETERLAAFAALVRKWTPRINLIAASTIDDLEQRHIADCQQLGQIAQPQRGRWLDLGSGGGFPGIVLAIMAADTEAQFHLVESDGRKAAFLRTAIRDLSLNATVSNARIEAIPAQCADAITARALAPLDRLVPYLQRHLRPGGEAWLMKGENWRDETQGGHLDGYRWHAYDSESRPGAAILRLTEETR